MQSDPNAVQKRQLEEELTRNGWKLVSRKLDDFDWWADEQWIIESQWSPRGFRLFLTFLVDGQHEGSRPKGIGVWAIGASQEPPSDQRIDGLEAQLRPGWDKELPRLPLLVDRVRLEESPPTPSCDVGSQ